MAFLCSSQLGLALQHHCLGGGLLAFALRDHGAGGEDGILRLAHLSLGLAQLGLQNLGVHACEDLLRLDEVALGDVDRDDAPGRLGRHVDLGGLDAPVATDEAIAEALGLQALPDQPASGCQHRQQCAAANPFLLFHAVHPVSERFPARWRPGKPIP
ncbi:hypothetical protein D9M71_712400 [compost metagenome]